MAPAAIVGSIMMGEFIAMIYLNYETLVEFKRTKDISLLLYRRFYLVGYRVGLSFIRFRTIIIAAVLLVCLFNWCRTYCHQCN